MFRKGGDPLRCYVMNSFQRQPPRGEKEAGLWRAEAGGADWRQTLAMRRWWCSEDLSWGGGDVLRLERGLTW